MNPLMIDNSTETKSPIIVALDYNNEHDVLNFISKVSPSVCRLKVGKELFTACGPKIVEKLVLSGYDVFLDLKFHDIPNTVYNACKVASELGVWMLNVHCSGGKKMMSDAVHAINDSTHKPLLIGVTILTSMSQDDFNEIGGHGELKTYVTNLAKLAHSSGLDGVVCSALEASIIKQNTANNFLTVTPGIRLQHNDKDVPTMKDDQTRIMHPIDAIQNKADYLVIGRPITQAIDPYSTLLTIISEIKES